MPYSAKDAPDYIPKDKKEQWAAIWNRVYAENIKSGMAKDKAESDAFKKATGVINNSRAASGEIQLVKLERWALSFVGGKDTNGQPKSCFNCPHLLKTQETCEYMNPNIIMRQITVGDKLYTPVCIMQIGGLPTETDKPTYMGKDPDMLGLEWAEGTGTNCDGYADGAPCKHFVSTHDHDGICDVMKEDDNAVDWDDCCAAHKGKFLDWKIAQTKIAEARVAVLQKSLK